MSDSMQFTEWESRQLEKRGQLLRDLCRKDRNLVWSRKKELKNSTTYQDAYITQDYAKAIQQERRTVIKAMKKSQSTWTRFQSY